MAKKAEPDLINHPPHYCQGGIECIDYVTAWDLDFCAGNIVKYVTRARHKGHELEDLKKAQFYLNYMVKRLESKPPAP